MIDNELPLIIPISKRPCLSPKPKETTLYLIFAYNTISGYWSKRESEYYSYEEAVEVAKTLNKLWQHVRIIEIKLP